MISYTDLVDEILRSTTRRRRGNRNKQSKATSNAKQQANPRSDGEQKPKRPRNRRGNSSADQSKP